MGVGAEEGAEEGQSVGVGAEAGEQVSTAPWIEGVGAEVEEQVSTALLTEGALVVVGCSAEVGVRGSAYSVGAGEVETVVGVALLGYEEVLRE